MVLVFDGDGTGRQIGQVRVVYSGRETADTVIERLSHRSASAAPGTVTVSRTTPSCATWPSAAESTQ